jgi:hypothetical protein
MRCPVLVLQDLPFTYRFASVVEGKESPLVASELSSNTYKPFLLPAGPAADNFTVYLVV